MTQKQRLYLTAALLPIAGYASWFAFTWLRFGHPRQLQNNPLLDIFMPESDVATNHSIRVEAPSCQTWHAILQSWLEASPLVRAIFRIREQILGAHTTPPPSPIGLIERLTSLGWGILAEIPGHTVVLGAATCPWDPNPVFESIDPDEFLHFNKPGYVKIAFSIAAHPLTANSSIAITETRAIATCSLSRRRFRNYWAVFSPGMALIRRQVLAQVKHRAEYRHRQAPTYPSPHTMSATETQNPNRAFEQSPSL